MPYYYCTVRQSSYNQRLSDSYVLYSFCHHSLVWMNSENVSTLQVDKTSCHDSKPDWPGPNFLSVLPKPTWPIKMTLILLLFYEILRRLTKFYSAVNFKEIHPLWINNYGHNLISDVVWNSFFQARQCQKQNNPGHKPPFKLDFTIIHYVFPACTDCCLYQLIIRQSPDFH